MGRTQLAMSPNWTPAPAGAGRAERGGCTVRVGNVTILPRQGGGWHLPDGGGGKEQLFRILPLHHSGDTSPLRERIGP
jgi:hypothetical protein